MKRLTNHGNVRGRGGRHGGLDVGAVAEGDLRSGGGEECGVVCIEIERRVS